MYPTESYFWTTDAEKPGNSRTVKMESCMAFVWKWQWQWFPGPYEPEFVLTPSTTTTLLVPFFSLIIDPLAKLFCRGVCQQYHLLAKCSTSQRSRQRQRGRQPPLQPLFWSLILLPCVGPCAWGSRQPAAGSCWGRRRQQIPVSASQARNLFSYSCLTFILMFWLSVHESWGFGGF